jgi:hypothetical protein
MLLVLLPPLLLQMMRCLLVQQVLLSHWLAQA